MNYYIDVLFRTGYDWIVEGIITEACINQVRLKDCVLDNKSMIKLIGPTTL